MGGLGLQCVFFFSSILSLRCGMCGLGFQCFFFFLIYVKSQVWDGWARFLVFFLFSSILSLRCGMGGLGFQCFFFSSMLSLRCGMGGLCFQCFFSHLSYLSGVGFVGNVFWGGLFSTILYLLLF